jgi:hypothetical protein
MYKLKTSQLRTPTKTCQNKNVYLKVSDCNFCLFMECQILIVILSSVSFQDHSLLIAKSLKNKMCKIIKETI